MYLFLIQKQFQHTTSGTPSNVIQPKIKLGPATGQPPEGRAASGVPSESTHKVFDPKVLIRFENGQDSQFSPKCLFINQPAAETPLPEGGRMRMGSVLMPPGDMAAEGRLFNIWKKLENFALPDPCRVFSLILMRSREKTPRRRRAGGKKVQTSKRKTFGQCRCG